MAGKTSNPPSTPPAASSTASSLNPSAEPPQLPTDSPEEPFFKPTHYTEMIMRGSELRIKFNRPIEMLDRFRLPVQNNEQESNFILKAGQLRSEDCGFLINGQSAGCIAFRLERDSPGL